MTGKELDTNVLAPIDSGYSLSQSQQSVSALTIATFGIAATIIGVLLWIILADSNLSTGPKVVIALSSVSTNQALTEEDGGTGTQTPSITIETETNSVRAERPWEAASDERTLARPDSLPPAPDEALTERGPNGLLPVISADGRKALNVYARPFEALDSPRIAIVIRGLGLSQKATEIAIDSLPPDITLAFVPYPKNLQVWVDQARARGHEVLLEIPMEPFGYPKNDPGPYTLLTEAGESENTRRLEWLLSRFTGYVGVTNYLGEKFVSSKISLAPVMRALESRGLLYLDDSGHTGAPVRTIADSINLVWGRSHRTFDRSSSVSIDSDLAALEAIARRDGFAVGTGFSFPVTIRAIAEWADTLPSKGLALAPVSATMEQ